MSLPQETLLQLMALSDGELEGDDKERALRLVAENEEARQVVDAMRSPAIGRWLREGMSERAAAADGIGDAVMASIERAERADAVNPTNPAKPAERASASGETAAEGGAVVRLARPQARRGSRASVVGGAVVAALAVAAGVTVYLRSADTNDGGMKAPVASVVAPSVLGPSPPAASAGPALAAGGAQRPSQGVEVDDVDSPSHGFSVFEIPLGMGVSAGAGAAKAAGPSSVVIMIDEDPGGR